MKGHLERVNENVREKAMTASEESFRCYLVKKIGKNIEAAVDRRPIYELPAGDVLIRVAYSSLNYKDAMAATGHPGLARHFPHVPGIDSAGVVVESSSREFRAGDSVVATSYELGVERWGGWSEYVRAPAEWVIPLPPGLSLEDGMTLGTAGLAAGLCVRALERHDVRPDSGDVVVTGATGGVGSLAVKLLARLGYSVLAISGKADQYAWLREQGAKEVLPREEILDSGKRPLLKPRFAGAVDTVGGNMLASLLKSMKQASCVTCCGVVGGADIATTIYPFILRGVTLAGIDTAWCSAARRRDVWNRYRGDWRLEGLDEIRTTIGLGDIDEYVQRILSGGIIGRTVIQIKRKKDTEYD
ncbi:MAG: YhdH/YhfP family quinone oxidoreductase [Pirellulaceae bacterium]